jgi:hypothetical protein
MGNLIRYHTTAGGNKIAELLPESDIVTSPGEMLEIIADVSYHECNALIINEKNLHNDFFRLKTGLAGEILQKFSNYRMQLSIVGNFAEIKSKSLNDFILESNKRRTVSFVSTFNEAISRLDRG